MFAFTPNAAICCSSLVSNYSIVDLFMTSLPLINIQGWNLRQIRIPLLNVLAEFIDIFVNPSKKLSSLHHP